MPNTKSNFNGSLKLPTRTSRTATYLNLNFRAAHMSSPPSEINHPSSDLDPEVLIKVDNVSKKFCRDFKKSLWYGLKDTAADIFHSVSVKTLRAVLPHYARVNSGLTRTFPLR